MLPTETLADAVLVVLFGADRPLRTAEIEHRVGLQPIGARQALRLLSADGLLCCDDAESWSLSAAGRVIAAAAQGRASPDRHQ